MPLLITAAPSFICTMPSKLTPAADTAEISFSTTSSDSIMKWVMGWRMMEYRARRMGRGMKLHRQPLMGFTPSSA